jgi:hypothetical protein
VTYFIRAIAIITRSLNNIPVLIVFDYFSEATKMPPNNTVIATSLPVEEIPVTVKAPKFDTSYRTLWGSFKTPLIWINIIGILSVHLIAMMGFITFPYFTHKLTVFWCNASFGF